MDTSTFLNIHLLPDLPGEVYISENVEREIKSQLANSILGISKSQFKINVVNPDEISNKAVKVAIKEIGEKQISNTDISVLALAVMLSKFDEVELISDDFSVRNIASHLNIPNMGFKQTKDLDVRNYYFRCTACLTQFQELFDECTVCGNISFKRYYRAKQQRP